MDNSLSSQKITVIEGPTPVFETAPESWLPSLAEGPYVPNLALTRLRTFNGPALVERCWKAWDLGRAVYLEYRDVDGLPTLAQIRAARYIETNDGHVLILYVSLDNE